MIQKIYIYIYIYMDFADIDVYEQQKYKYLKHLMYNIFCTELLAYNRKEYADVHMSACAHAPMYSHILYVCVRELAYSCILAFKYSCIHVSKYACNRAFKFALVHLFMYSSTDIRTQELVHACTHALVYACIHALIASCMHVHMHPCTDPFTCSCMNILALFEIHARTSSSCSCHYANTHSGSRAAGFRFLVLALPV